MGRRDHLDHAGFVAGVVAVRAVLGQVLGPNQGFQNLAQGVGRDAGAARQLAQAESFSERIVEPEDIQDMQRFQDGSDVGAVVHGCFSVIGLFLFHYSIRPFQAGRTGVNLG